MRCRECGLEVDNEKAFCPICGAPMKVTADYDYIQAEIANKVDRFFNEEVEEKNKKNDQNTSEQSKTDLLDEIIDAGISEDADDIKHKQTAKKKNADRQSKKSSSERDEFAKTRNIYGSDSVFSDEEFIDNTYDPYEEEETVRRKKSGKGTSEKKQRHPVRIEKVRRRPEIVEEYYEPKDQTAAKVITVLIIFVIIAACAVGVMAITGVFGNGGSQSSKVSSNISSLTSNITPGNIYSDPVQITLTSSSDGNIFYTLDGTEPSIDSKMYTGPFTVSAMDVPRTYPTVNLRAVSFGSDSVKSGDLNITFEFEYNEAFAPTVEEETQKVFTSLEAPQIVPESGPYTTDISITVVSPDGVDIYYTYDGTTPTASSQKYTGPVKMIPGSSVFSAVCIAEGFESAVSTANYDLDYGFAITPDAAIWSTKEAMIWLGITSDYDGNTWEGGHADIKHVGVYTIDDYTYYILEADVFGADGIIQNTYFYGIGVNYGGFYTAERNGSSFTIYQ